MSATIRAADRALTIAQLLAEQGPLGVTEIGHRMSVGAGTAHRLLASLMAHGLVEQPTPHGKYQLVPGVVLTRQAPDVVAFPDGVTVTRRSSQHVIDPTKTLWRFQVNDPCGAIVAVFHWEQTANAED